MEAISKIISRTAVLPFRDIDTDQIIPARFLTTTGSTGLGRHAFADWRYDEQGAPKADFALNQIDLSEHRILVAGANFGCGSSREHAPWALLDLGFQAVISTHIADIFRANALKNGLLPIVVDAETHSWLMDHPGEVVEIDLPESRLTLPEGRSIQFPLDAFAKLCLLRGVDELGYLLEQREHIAHFESRRGS